jgi:hypothetical protein
MSKNAGNRARREDKATGTAMTDRLGRQNLTKELYLA